MAGLAETLVESHSGINFSFDEDLGAEATEIEFKRAALNEIDRLRRIDEWIPSYRNLFTLAALRGLTRVIDAKVAPRRMSYFMKYTRPGNQDEVRLTAFECLINLGMLSNTPFLRYILHSFSTERSPYVRERLWRIIGRGLGLIALGITPTTGQSNLNGFSIAEGENLESRNEKNSRTQTVEGAVKSLKQQLCDNQILKEAVIDALRYSHSCLFLVLTR
jgi:transcription initiation factor TFIID subunit 2